MENTDRPVSAAIRVTGFEPNQALTSRIQVLITALLVRKGAFVPVQPKAAKLRETRRRSLAGLYVPAGERRMIAQDDQVHPSVSARLTARADYRPPNLPAGKAAKQDRRQ